MAKILVAGLINTETTVQIERFPVEYTPVRYAFNQISSSVSGVGFNIAKALSILGNDVHLHSLIGDDLSSQAIRTELDKLGINHDKVLTILESSPQSVILYDDDGKRMINTDLKTIQDRDYPLENLALDRVDIAILANINFSRAILQPIKDAHIQIATDIHTISNIDDEYNQDYMAMADILFMSHEGLPTSPENWIHQLWERFGTAYIGIGMGAEGAIIAIRDSQQIIRVPTYSLRPVINTVGAGDALFSSFVHSLINDKDPLLAMQKAVLFASYKVGATGGSTGFMTSEQLSATHQQYF